MTDAARNIYGDNVVLFYRSKEFEPEFAWDVDSDPHDTTESRVSSLQFEAENSPFDDRRHFSLSDLERQIQAVKNDLEDMKTWDNRKNRPTVRTQEIYFLYLIPVIITIIPVAFSIVLALLCSDLFFRYLGGDLLGMIPGLVLVACLVAMYIAFKLIVRRLKIAIK